MTLPQESLASTLCQVCGLCCTGHLFIWVRLNAPELKPCQSLGLRVIRDDPRQRGFLLPCPMWHDICTVYASPHYPRSCRSYHCKLLKELQEENITLPAALNVIERAKEMIRALDALLPDAPLVNFRERLVVHIEQGNADANFRSKADSLLAFYEMQFGVKDLLDT